MKRPKISRRAETRPYGRVSAPTRNCRRFLTQLYSVFSAARGGGPAVGSDPLGVEIPGDARRRALPITHISRLTSICRVAASL